MDTFVAWLDPYPHLPSPRSSGPRRSARFLRHLFPLLLILFLASCGESGPAVPAALQIVAGDGQTGTVGQAVAQTLQVRVVDANGSAIADVTVSWGVTAGGGSVGQSSSVSGSDGVASVTWTLGTEVGAQRVTAEAGGASTIFSATAVAGPPAAVTVTPANAPITALNGTVQMIASLEDGFGNPVAGGDFQWASGDEAVVTVASDGVATGLVRGAAQVTATDLTSGLAGSAQVEVTQVASTVSVSPQDAIVAVGGLVGLTAVVADAGGSNIPDAEVGWTTSDGSVVTVDGSGVATGVAEGDATISATSGNATGETTVTVVLTADDFAPVSDSQVDGDVTVGEMTVPAGVTLTFTANATITALGDVNIAGDVVGSCVQMAIQGRGAATYSGTFDNSCPEETEEGGPDMILVNSGPLTVSGATFTYAGELDVRNGPPLATNAAVSGPGSQTRGPTFTANSSSLSGNGPARANGANFCVVDGATFRPSNPTARNGADGTSGAQSGANARGVRLSCAGDLEMGGGTNVESRDGGAGGDAENFDPQSDNASGKGADGGKGGDLTVEADGDINFDGQGGGTTVRLSSGGKGGDATVLGRDPGGNATAEGGSGGDGGNVRVEATGGITVSPGGLTLLVGVGGAGGEAIANAGNGLDAGEGPATAGGSATATGGAGGSSVEGQLRASGAVGGLQNITITGGDGGKGGEATAVGGKGGDGNLEHPHGADGGAMAASGGKGGEAKARTPLGTIIGTSGDGGNIRLVNGRGGNGADRCSIPASGGNGGKGGDGAGTPGAGGGGDSPGNPGSISVAAATGNGGDGDDGEDPGVGGDGGTDRLAQGFQRTDEGPVFQDGIGGEECPEEPPVETEADPSSMDVPQGVVPPGQYQVTLRNVVDNLIVGAILMEALGPSGNAFWASNPPRFGWAAPWGWLIYLNALETVQPGLGLELLTICFLNTFPTAEDPAVVESQNSDGETVGTHSVTNEGGCTEIAPEEGVTRIRVRGRSGGPGDARIRIRVRRR